MCRLKTYAFLSLLFASALALLQSPRCFAQKEKSLSDQIAAIKQEHAELEKWFHDTLVADRKDEKKIRDANTKYFEKLSVQAKALQSLIKGHPADKGTFDAILLLVGELNYFLDDEITQIVLERHL